MTSTPDIPGQVALALARFLRRDPTTPRSRRKLLNGTWARHRPAFEQGLARGIARRWIAPAGGSLYVAGQVDPDA